MSRTNAKEWWQQEDDFFSIHTEYLSFRFN